MRVIKDRECAVGQFADTTGAREGSGQWRDSESIRATEAERGRQLVLPLLPSRMTQFSTSPKLRLTPEMQAAPRYRIDTQIRIVDALPRDRQKKSQHCMVGERECTTYGQADLESPPHFFFPFLHGLQATFV
jgi:hypothetical protein